MTSLLLDPGDPTRDGDVWVFPNGRTLPVVSGGSDTPTSPRADQIAQIIGQGPQPQPAPAAAPAAAPVAPVETAPVAAAPVETAPPATEDGTVFTREYVEQLRREAADARAVFSGLHNDDRAALEQFARAVAEGDDDYLDAFILRVAETRGLAVGQPDPATPTTPYGQPQPPQQQQPLTAADVQRIADERAQAMRAEWEQQQQAAAARARVDAEFRDLGLDPASPVAEQVRAFGARLCHERRVFVPPAEVLAEWRRLVAPIVGGQPAPPPPETVPPVATGQPAVTDPFAGMTGDQRALARLEAARQGRAL